MSFREKHPYLFWQLIGWVILIADFGFLVLSALQDFGEWCYPVIVFTFIGGLFVVTVSPILVRLKRRRLVPQNEDAVLESVISVKLNAINMARRGVGFDVLMGVLGFGSVIGFLFAAYILGERVSLALGFACLVLALAAPFVIIGIYSKHNARKFFTVKNGEKRVELKPLTMPAELAALRETNPKTLLFSGEPSAVLLNFFYNWLAYYIKEENPERKKRAALHTRSAAESVQGSSDSERSEAERAVFRDFEITRRLTLYKIPAPELCAVYQPKDILQYGDVLLVIPEEQFDLTGEKLALFRRECDIIGALPFSYLVDRE